MPQSKQLRWLRGLFVILARPWRVILGFMIIAATVLIAKKLAPDGQVGDYVGGVLQIVGLLLVLLQIFRTASDFATHPFVGVTAWLSDLWRHFRPRTYVMNAAGASFTLDGADLVAGTAISYDRNDPSSRMDYLERVIELHKAEEVARRAELWKAIEGVQGEVTKVVTEHNARAEAIEAKIRNQSIGNLDASIIGVILTIVGTALSSF